MARPMPGSLPVSMPKDQPRQFHFAANETASPRRGASDRQLLGASGPLRARAIKRTPEHVSTALPFWAFCTTFGTGGRGEGSVRASQEPRHLSLYRKTSLSS